MLTVADPWKEGVNSARGDTTFRVVDKQYFRAKNSQFLPKMVSKPPQTSQTKEKKSPMLQPAAYCAANSWPSIQCLQYVRKAPQKCPKPAQPLPPALR